jgi:hypothetical protein
MQPRLFRVVRTWKRSSCLWSPFQLSAHLLPA